MDDELRAAGEALQCLSRAWPELCSRLAAADRARLEGALTQALVRTRAAAAAAEKRSAMVRLREDLEKLAQRMEALKEVLPPSRPESDAPQRVRGLGLTGRLPAAETHAKREDDTEDEARYAAPKEEVFEPLANLLVTYQGLTGSTPPSR